MEKDSVWGGQLEMNALANALKFNVIVHQVDNPSMVQVFHEPIGKVPTIHLSYHLGEHYNSVRRIDDTCIVGQAPIKFFKIGHDIENVKTLIGNYKSDDHEQFKDIAQFAL
jgi:OTU domain-containing protein 3